MSKIKMTLQVIESIREVANSLEELVEALQKSEPPAEEGVKPEEKPPSFEEVRAKLTGLSQAGKQAEVKQLITDLGATKLSDISPEQYTELLEKAGQL